MDPYALIRGFEGYRDKPYWDVNAYRIGYGSDTITGPDGRAVRVTPGMTVDRASADADLKRRVDTEFMPIAQRAVGDKWTSLNDAQRSALTSIAYNYGRVPDSVAQAVRNGGDVVGTIRALSRHNNGINANRRNAEATLYGGGLLNETMSSKGGPMPEQDLGPNNGPLGGLLGIKRDTSRMNDLGIALMALSSPRAAPAMMQMLQNRRDERKGRQSEIQSQQTASRTAEWLRAQPGGAQFAELANVLGPAEALKAYQAAVKGSDPTALQQNYEFLLKLGKSPEEALAMAKGGQTINVNTGPNSSKFTEESDKAAAARFDTYIQEGAKAGQFMGDLQALAQLGTQIETGAGAQVMGALGPYAQALGVDVEGLAPAQAYKAITDRLAPMMRAPGSGATSDFEGRQFLNALPSLGRTPEGNQIVLETLQALQQHKIAAAEIASRAQSGQMSWQDAEKQIRELGNPYEAFSEFRKRSEASGKEQPAFPGAPPIGTVQDGYRYNGGNPADQNNWEKAQ